MVRQFEQTNLTRMIVAALKSKAVSIAKVIEHVEYHPRERDLKDSLVEIQSLIKRIETEKLDVSLHSREY